ncbi:PaaI family thioesterase [Alcaligenaceae bacterium]|nr:PaaI family thioesterase [Alcaligenaceae bacterium]
MSETELKQRYIALGWTAFEDPGFISHAGPFFQRDSNDGPTFSFQVLEKHENRNGMLQGGALMTFVDRALGATARQVTQTAATVTVTLTVQFVEGVKIGETVEVTPSMIRATKQLIFMTGTFTVNSRVVCVANGVWKKINTPPKVSATTSVKAG